MQCNLYFGLSEDRGRDHEQVLSKHFDWKIIYWTYIK